MDYRSPLEDAYECEQTSIPVVYPNRYRPLPPRTTHGERYLPYTQSKYPYNDERNKASSSRAVKEHSNSDCSLGKLEEDNDQKKVLNFQKELNALMGAKECKLCAVELQSPIVVKTHYSGKQHIKNVRRYCTQWSLTTGLRAPEIVPQRPTINDCTLDEYCELCDVRMTTTSDKLLHYSGKNHQKNVQDPRRARRKKKRVETIDLTGRFEIGEQFVKGIPMERNVKKVDFPKECYKCNLCDVKAATQEQLNQHLNGKKHKDKFLKKALGTVKKERPFPCSLCDITLETCSLLQLHLNGKKHKKNVMKLETAALEEAAKTKRTCQFCHAVLNSENHVCDKFLPNNYEGIIEATCVCSYCNYMVFNTEQKYKEHLKSYDHVLRVYNNSHEKGDIMIEELSYWYCRLCRIQYNSSKDYTNHLFEEKHMKLSQENLEMCDDINLFHCSECDLMMPNNYKDQHLEDPKHIRDSLRADTLKLLKDLANKDINTISYTCDNCRAGPFTFVQYSEHLLGEAHAEVMIELKLLQMKSSKAV